MMEGRKERKAQRKAARRQVEEEFIRRKKLEAQQNNQ
jgi:hypothetical protein